MLSRSSLVLLAIACLAGAGCGTSDDRLVVFAASSLAEVMEDVETAWENEHPGLDVVVNLAGSSSLVAQIADGAPADVLVTADFVTMQRARDAGAAVEPVPLAFNQLVIAVEPGNPHDIRSENDLERDDVIVVMAADEVPAGAYSAEVLDCAGVEVAPASLEQSVRAVAAKVKLGEADAALVYRTDIDADLEAVELSLSCQVRAEYVIAAIGESIDAQEFVAAMTGPLGRDALSSEGFALP